MIPFTNEELLKKFKDFDSDELGQIVFMCEFTLKTGKEAEDKRSNLALVKGSRVTTTRLLNQIKDVQDLRNKNGNNSSP